MQMMRLNLTMFLKNLFSLPCMVLATVMVGTFGAPQAYSDPRCTRIDARATSGVIDYRLADDKYKRLVENTHFTTEHQREAMRGNLKASGGGTWGNLDYTLRRFPNHPRALYLIGILELQVKKNDEEKWRKLTLEPIYAPFMCYFERAARFAPDDPGVPNAFGILLHRAGRQEEALESFRRAVTLAPEAPEAHYNLGLSQFALGHYEQAATSARRAYALGYQKQDLKVKLKRKGHWK